MILRSSAEVPSLICLEEFPDINDTSDSDSEFIPFFILFFFIIIVILEIILRMCAEIKRRSAPWPMTYMKGSRSSKIRTGNVILGRHRSKRRGRSCSRHLHWSRRIDRNFRPNRFLDFLWPILLFPLLYLLIFLLLMTRGRCRCRIRNWRRHGRRGRGRNYIKNKNSGRGHPHPHRHTLKSHKSKKVVFE